MFATFFFIGQVLNPGLIQPVLCADNSLKEYKPHAKDSEKEMDIGEGEKGVVHSYLRVDIYTPGHICIV